MHTTRRRLTAGAAALTLALTVAACGDDTAPATDQQTTTTQSPTGQGTEAASEHNDADTQFAQMMIVHHEGAVEMAELAAEQATTPEVKELAEAIADAQGPEIELMSGWLEAWGEDEPDHMDMGGMDHGGMDMDGMDQQEAMDHLHGMSGADFDRRFLELMTAHHQGAIEMAEEELADGQNPDALGLAQKIVDDQTAEIAEMREMLQDL